MVEVGGVDVPNYHNHAAQEAHLSVHLWVVGSVTYRVSHNERYKSFFE